MKFPPKALLQRAALQAGLVAILLALLAVVAPTSQAQQPTRQRDRPILVSEFGLDGVVGFERYGSLTAFKDSNGLTGHPVSYSWDYAALPPGIYGLARGLWAGLYGIPTEAGVFTPIATVATDDGTDTLSARVTVYETVAELPGIEWFDHVPGGELNSVQGEDIGTVVLAQGIRFEQGYQLRGLPPGIDYTGVDKLHLTGAATEPGTYEVTVFESDRIGGSQAYYSTFTFRVQNEEPLTVDGFAGQDGVVGFERTQGLATFEVHPNVDNPAWDFIALPPGTYGRGYGDRAGIFGTPTEAGVFGPTATATTPDGSASHKEHVTIHATLEELPGIEWFDHVLGGELTSVRGEDIGYLELEQGLLDDQAYEVQGLPPGIDYTDSHNLVLTGTPSEVGSFEVTIFESGLAGGPEAYYSRFTWNVLSAGAPEIASSPGLAGIVGFKRYGSLANFSVGADDGQVRWYFTDLPTGTFHRDRGVNTAIFGTPTQAGVFPITANAETSDGTGVDIQEITVYASFEELPDTQWFEHVPGGELTSNAGEELGGLFLEQGLFDDQGYQLRGLPDGVQYTAAHNLYLTGAPSEPGEYEVTIFESDLAGGPEAFFSTFIWNVVAPEPEASDLDSDGVADAIDVCPTLAGVDQTEDDCRADYIPGEPIWNRYQPDNWSWSTNPDGTDTATTGLWGEGYAEESRWNNTLLQPGTPYEIVATGPALQGGVGANDVDNGSTTIRSPEIELPDEVGLELTVDWYFGHLRNASWSDTFEIWVQEVGTYNAVTVVEESGNFRSRDADWQETFADLSSLAGRTVRVHARAVDADRPSLVEAGFVNARIAFTTSVPRFHPTGDEWFSSVGQSVDVFLGAMDGNEGGEIDWTFDGLPPGIDVAEEGRRAILAGTVTTPGTYEVTATITQTWNNTPGSAVKHFVWTVDDAPPPNL